ncbi:hypothetical protein [Pseudomonas sp. TNT3]|nr:hypothetical protein [Pseudomonas sp. TNT3]
MSAFLNGILIHLFIGFMLVAAGGVLWGIRRLERRARIARGNHE